MYELSMYRLRKGRLPFPPGEKPAMTLRTARVYTMAEAKAVWRDWAGYLPEWLATLDDPAEYVQVEYDLQDGDGTYNGYGVSIEGSEVFPDNQVREASEKWRREHGGAGWMGEEQVAGDAV